jgi:hypothetical protein
MVRKLREEYNADAIEPIDE